MLWNKKKFFSYLALFIILYFLVLYLSSFLPEEKLQFWAEQLGLWGPVMIISYFVFAEVVAPISGFPAWLAAYALYDTVAFVYLYIAHLISGAICFHISKVFGRKWIRRLGGKKFLKDVDRTSETLETGFLALFSLVAFPMFELVSYAAGLTQISYRRFFIVTSTCLAIAFASMALMFHQYAVTLPLMVLLSAIVVIFAFFLTALQWKNFGRDS